MIPRPYESFSPLKRLYRQRELKGPEGAPASLPVTCTHLIKGQVMEVGRTSSYESELSDASKTIYKTPEDDLPDILVANGYTSSSLTTQIFRLGGCSWPIHRS